MAVHTYSNNGKTMSYEQAQQKVKDIQSVNSKVGANGWTQKIVPSGNGFIVEERPPEDKK